MRTLTQVETFSRPDIAIERRADGTIILTERQPLGDYEDSLAAVLAKSAKAHSHQPLAAEHDEQGRWVTLTYGEAKAKADALAQAFLDLGLGPGLARTRRESR